MSASGVALTVSDRVATITLDRPPRNAFTAGMGRALSDAYRRCDSDDEVRAVVLTGAPPAFCAGADLAAGDESLAGPAASFTAGGVDFPAWRVRKPVIAAVNGHAVGIGLTLALQCDLRIMAQESTYGVVQVRRGVLGDAWSHWVLPRMVGMARAAEVLLLGGTFGGSRALELGLCSRVLPAGDVLTSALELARDAAANAAPLSVAASKRLLWSSFECDADAVAEAETEWHRRLMVHEDAREGVRAWREGRDPQWAGRLSEIPQE